MDKKLAEVLREVDNHESVVEAELSVLLDNAVGTLDFTDSVSKLKEFFEKNPNLKFKIEQEFDDRMSKANDKDLFMFLFELRKIFFPDFDISSEERFKQKIKKWNELKYLKKVAKKQKDEINIKPKVGENPVDEIKRLVGANILHQSRLFKRDQHVLERVKDLLMTYRDNSELQEAMSELLDVTKQNPRFNERFVEILKEIKKHSDNKGLIDENVERATAYEKKVIDDTIEFFTREIQ